MRKVLISGVAVVALLLALGGCAKKYSAERDGKKLGEAICDLRGADSEEEAKDAADDIAEQLDDIGRKYSTFTAEDRADIQENLADLAEHSIQGNEILMQQDLAVLRRSADNIRNDVGETDAAVLDGLEQGLSSCTE